MLKSLPTIRKTKHQREAPPNDPSRTVHSLNKSSETCNILLEFGEMDLEGYFGERLTPVLSKEIEEFWKALFAVAYAVKDIHNFKVSRAGVVEEYHGSVKRL